MTQAHDPLQARAAVERRAALRRLLGSPLLLAERDPEDFALVVRHRVALSRWFSEQAGWTLTVEPAAGHARLFKRPARRDATRPARVAGKPPFDRRRYALLCLALAALDDGPPQVTLARLAAGVRDLSLEDSSIPAFDPDLPAERAAFVDVLRLLGELGVLALRDGEAERFTRQREADALYDVRERLLSQLLAAPVPPSLAGSPARMCEEEGADTEEGHRRRARWTVFRRLLDDPVLYLDELDARSAEWLEHGRGFLYERLEEDAGLTVERRLEGLAAVDPAGELTDTVFPEGSSTVKHAALLLGEWFADLHRAGGAAPRTLDEVAARVGELLREHEGRWSKAYPADGEGARRLAGDALALLEAFGLARHSADGWSPRPAVARFVPGAALPRGAGAAP